MDELDNKIDLHKVFDNYVCIYKNILNHIWPSIGSTGFAERNLSVNFCKSYEKYALALNQDVITWFEFQITGKSGRNDNHIDAVIINFSTKEIFMIESKRFSKVEEKKSEVLEDISRLNDNKINACFEGRLENINDYKVYGCILADVWGENDEKEKIVQVFSEFKNKTIIGKTFFKQLFYNGYKVDDKYIKGIEKCENKELSIFLKKVYTTKYTHNTYYLTSFMWMLSEGSFGG